MAAIEHSANGKTLEEIRKDRGRLNLDVVDRTTEANIERHEREDGPPLAEHLDAMRVVVGGPDVAALRARFGISQNEFADRFGLALRTVQQWEQRRRAPDLTATRETPRAVLPME